MPKLTRRQLTSLTAAALLQRGRAQTGPAQPNILWITCEDIGPDLHVCGQSYSVTPNLDALAQRGLLYMNAWSNAPVCAPARTTIISGLYPPATGSEHMRSTAKLPTKFRMFPQYLREAGYYCTNNVKEDYNLEKPGKVWDESSNRAHWRNRRPGQPFFAVFNNIITHESQLRTRPHNFVHDPAQAPLPSYHPDTPEVRQDWAQYYDNITTMDGWAGQLLGELKKDGLDDSTVVFFYGDHGSGMPGKKRCARNAGLNVSIIAYFPEKFRALAPPEYRAGAKSDRMIGFIDLAPTMLSLAGLKPPEYFQGQAFAGSFQAGARQYNYGFRGRMDERYDMVRTVRDKQFVYVRNYMPHKPAGQHVDYMFQTPATRVWKKMYDEGRLNRAQSHFWEPRPAEELYELSSDPDEVNNLAQSPKHRDVLLRMRAAQQLWVRNIRDVGFLPEGEIHSRSAGSTPWDMGHSARLYPMERVMEQAESAASLTPESVARLAEGLRDDDSAVRYWSALGFVVRGETAVKNAQAPLRKALGDSSPYVCIAAAEALGRYSSEPRDVEDALTALVKLAPSGRNDHYVALMALNALDALGEKARLRLTEIQALSTEDPRVDEREKTHCELVRKWIVAQLSSGKR